MRRLILISALSMCVPATEAQTIGLRGSPYTATKKTTLVQKLVDGTTITRTTIVKEARDSEGRTLQERHQENSRLGQNSTNSVIMDPVARVTLIWMTPGKEVTRSHMPDPRPRPTQPAQPGSANNAVGIGPAINVQPVAPRPQANDGERPRSQNEKLAGRNISGVDAEGVRITTTYPIGWLGNDRPIVQVRETWTSPELHLIVLSTDDDPRTGLTTTEVTDIDRSEPDPALFQIPEGYTIREQYQQAN